MSHRGPPLWEYKYNELNRTVPDFHNVDLGQAWIEPRIMQGPGCNVFGADVVYRIRAAGLRTE